MCDTTPCTTAQHSCDSRETPSFCHAFSGHALMYREGSAGVGSTHEQLLSWPRLLHVEGVRAQRTGQVTEHAASASEAVLHADKVWILGAGNALLQWNGDASHNRAVEHVVVPHGKPAAARSWRALGMPDRAIGRPSAFSVPSHSICAPMSMPIDRVVPDDRHSSSPKGTRAALRPLSVSGILLYYPFLPSGVSGLAGAASLHTPPPSGAPWGVQPRCRAVRPRVSSTPSTFVRPAQMSDLAVRAQDVARDALAVVSGVLERRVEDTASVATAVASPQSWPRASPRHP